MGFQILTLGSFRNFTLSIIHDLPIKHNCFLLFVSALYYNAFSISILKLYEKRLISSTLFSDFLYYFLTLFLVNILEIGTGISLLK